MRFFAFSNIALTELSLENARERVARARPGLLIV